jgi:hypothetical protein
MKLRTRIVGALGAMIAVVTIGGGSLVATATPSSAAAGGTNVCTSFTETATIDPVTFVVTAIGTFSGCQQQGSGTFEYSMGPDQDPTAPGLLTINWATGHAASEVLASTVPRVTVDPRCPVPYTATIDLSFTVVHGPYAGSTGQAVECIDFSGLPNGIVRGLGVGPVVI